MTFLAQRLGMSQTRCHPAALAVRQRRAPGPRWRGRAGVQYARAVTAGKPESSSLARGVAHLLAGRVPEAIAALSDAAREDLDGVAQHDLALALRAAGDLPGATRVAEAAAARTSRAATLALLASLRLLAGRRQAAVALLRAALALEPAHAPSRYQLGLVTGDARLVRGALAGLPAVVAARAEAQARELEAGGRLQGDLCGAPLVSEVLLPDARGRREADPGVGDDAAAGAAATIDVDGLTALIAGAARPVALTGAGLSRASGLRTRKELWETFERDAAVSVWRFHEEPRALWSVIRDFLGGGGHAPNAAHVALARLPLAGVVTQNVDGLHQATGTRAPIVELHGSLLATRCDACGARGPACAALLDGPLPPPCPCGAALRPDVVLFGEWVAPDRLARARALVERCDLLLVVGTAADVSPAADLVRLAAARGAPVVEVKRRPSRLHEAAGTRHLPGAAEDVLPAVVERLRARGTA